MQAVENAEVESHLEAIATEGFVLLEDVFDASRARKLRDRVREIERETLQDTESGTPVDGSSQLRTSGLLRLDPLFWDVPIEPAILSVVEGVLGRDFLLTTFSAIDVRPGRNKQPVHPDDALIPLERPHQPIVCTCMWAVTDFTPENGATRLLPGSHKRAEAPDYTRDYADMLPAEMRAGSVLVFDGSLWHQAADNTTEEEWRLGLQVSYCAGWIRPFSNHFLSIPREEAERFPERLTELLGYSTFNGAIGTIGVPGTNRYANSAFRHPSSVLASDRASRESEA